MLNYDECWRAVQKHDASRDGRVFFGVLTTGIYCKPSCASRQPLRKNVRFYEGWPKPRKTAFVHAVDASL
jgi:AraC family transcriptional regulator of adaptative response/methylated-DNA-[protein]-cysteine methyltransferase